MTLGSTRWLALGAVFALMGCGDDDGTPRRDAGMVILDGGPRDTGPDTGGPRDTGPRDTGRTGMCPSGGMFTCDPVEQDCMTAGQACYFGGSGTTCAAAGMVAGEGMCNPMAPNDCQEGYICVGNGTSMTEGT